ncbi:MAG: DUF655 domain-containing protein [Candidatus Ranarchaeia archaeon]
MAGYPNKLSDSRAIVLDFMPEGKSIGKPTGPLAQAIGEAQFTFYELSLASTVSLQPKQFISLNEKVSSNYIIKRKVITYDELTDSALKMLEPCITIIVETNEERYVNFFNRAMPITTRLHQLELLPGVGKKYLWDIIRQRKIRQFTSFEDLTERVKISDPKKAIIRRILLELKHQEKYYLFIPRPKIHEKTTAERGPRFEKTRRTGYTETRRKY